MLFKESFVDLNTPTGTMRTFLYHPVPEGKYPGVVLFSEIYQRTGPIHRTAALLAGHGFIVAVPDIFHEFEPLGTALNYDTEGTDKGNRYKVGKTVQAYDDDARAVIAHLSADPRCTGRLGAVGICIGGHLSFRAAMNPEILAAACYYATDIHKRSLGLGGDNSLDRLADIKGELLMIWGKQDPHIPQEGRQLIYQSLSQSGTNFTWHEFNGQHAFIRDEGHRYDPALALTCYRLVIDLLTRRLALS
jgi:carboxymethylenebutenolidase